MGETKDLFYVFIKRLNTFLAIILENEDYMIFHDFQFDLKNYPTAYKSNAIDF